LNEIEFKFNYQEIKVGGKKWVICGCWKVCVFDLILPKKEIGALSLMTPKNFLELKSIPRSFANKSKPILFELRK